MYQRRLQLQEIFEDILGTDHVYFQPPASIQLKYPAIIFERTDIRKEHADDLGYIANTMYKVTVIDWDPDSRIVEAVSKLPGCSFSTHFASDNLNHDVFNLY